MDSNPRWIDDPGRFTIQSIVKLRTGWKAGLRDYQLTLVSRVLDGEDILFISATGDGKSVAFSIPILVLHEYNSNNQLYFPGLPTRPNPMALVITPTKGLSNNIVSPFMFHFN
jgi:ATP-dependent helicase YprA (DUF1998 family)